MVIKLKKERRKQVMYKAVDTSKMMVIWDGLAGHLTVLATTSCNCRNIRMFTDSSPGV